MVAGHHAREPQHGHGGKQRPALPRVPHHFAERVSQRPRNQKNQEHLKHIRERRGVFERMRGVRIEETAAIGAQHLNRFLRRHWPLRDGLLRAFQRGNRRVRMQVLDHALRAQHQRREYRNRQQDIEGRSRQIGPEISDSLQRVPRETAHQSDGDSQSRGGGKEVMHRQPRHLDEVTDRGFRHVTLPVRVGRETYRRIKRQIRTYIVLAESLRIKRQPDLQPLDRVQQHRARHAERKQRAGIAGPVLLLRLAFGVRPHAAQPVNQFLHRSKDRTQEIAPPFHYVRDQRAERFGAGHNQREENRDLYPSIDSHFSEPFRPQQRVQQIHAERQRNHACNHVFHFISPVSGSELFARACKHPRDQEKAHNQQAVDQIRHGADPLSPKPSEPCNPRCEAARPDVPCWFSTGASGWRAGPRNPGSTRR